MTISRTIYLATSILLSALLIFAGVAKTQASTWQLVNLGVEPQRLTYLLIGSVEITIGIALLLRSELRLTWILAFGAFLSFTIYSYFNRDSNVRCGCMGDVAVKSGQLFVVNVVATTLSGVLLLRKMLGRSDGLLPAFTANPALISGVLSVLVLSSNLFHLDRYFAVPRLLVIDEKAVQANEYISEGGFFSCVAKVHNVSNREIRIVGFKQTCGVKHLTRMPIVVPPGDCSDLALVSSFPKHQLSGEVSFDYFADNNGELVEGTLVVQADLKNFTDVFRPK